MKSAIFAVVTSCFVAAPVAYADSLISSTTVNFRHLGWDQNYIQVPDWWDIGAEVHLADDGSGFDPYATNVSVSWPPSESAALHYLSWFYDIWSVHSFFEVIASFSDPPTISEWETAYTFQVEGGPSQQHVIQSGTFIEMDLAVTSWDADTGLLSWNSIPQADVYFLWRYDWDPDTSSLIGTDATNLGTQLSHTVDLAGKPYQIIGLQALDIGNGAVLINQSEYFTVLVAPVLQVIVDIKPGSDPNSINPFSRGVIPVAILTTEDFDALTVDADSVLFGPAEAEKKHKRAHVEDVDDDGDLDLVLHFRTQDTGIALGDTEACVIGQTYDGVPIEGCDSVRTVSRK